MFEVYSYDSQIFIYIIVMSPFLSESGSLYRDLAILELTIDQADLEFRDLPASAS